MTSLFVRARAPVSRVFSARCSRECSPAAFRLGTHRVRMVHVSRPVVAPRDGSSRIMRDLAPDIRRAYAHRLDIQGDLFDAMRVANEVEEIKVTAGQRLRILLSLWKS